MELKVIFEGEIVNNNFCSNNVHAVALWDKMAITNKFSLVKIDLYCTKFRIIHTVSALKNSSSLKYTVSQVEDILIQKPSVRGTSQSTVCKMRRTSIIYYKTTTIKNKLVLLKHSFSAITLYWQVCICSQWLF